MVTNIIRRKERSGTSSQASNTRLMDGELGVLTDVKKLIVGDGSKRGGYCLTPDNIVANCIDQADPNENLSLAWWINYANGSDIKLRIVSGVYNFLNDLSIPSNIFLDIDKGAVFNISSEKTLTLNCQISVDSDFEFSGDGNVVENYTKNSITINNVEPMGSGGVYVAFGDSIVYGYTADETPRRSPYNYIAAIGKVTGLDETINAAVGGQGQFSAGPNSEGNAYSWLTSHENLITRATLITLAWGKNDKNYTLGTSSDAPTENTICGRWKKCLNYIRSVNSDAQIIIISSIKYANVGWDEPLGTGNWSLDDLAREVGAVAEQYNIPYITWKKCGIMNNLGVRAHDNTHPDSFTYKLMGAYIAGQIGYWFRNVWDL